MSDAAAAAMAGFLAELRAHGFRAGPQEGVAALDLTLRLKGRLPEVRTGLKALLCGCREDWQRFDPLFEAWWLGRGIRSAQAAGGPSSASPPRRLDPLQSRPADAPLVWERHFQQMAQIQGPQAPGPADDEGEEADPGRGRLIACASARVRRTDLRHLQDPETQAEAMRIAHDLARALRYRLSRQRVPSPAGRSLDLRRTLRGSLRTGGEPFRLIRRRRPEQPVSLVAFLDVSGSMEPYARVFVPFLRGLVGGPVAVDAYLLHTRLVRMTEALADRDALRALSRMALLAEGYGGGTRLAAGLGQFNRQHAKSVLTSRSVVLILSDGYDSDPPEALAEALAELRRRARRILWLNPLKGWAGYQPVARGMAAALPFLDHFAACHTLDELAALEPVLARL